MTAFKRNGGWAAKYVDGGRQVWVKGGPWPTKKMAEEAERQDRQRRELQPSELTCREFAHRWLVEWERPAAATQRLYRAAALRFADDFGDQLLCEVDRFTARTWALGVPRKTAKIVATLYQDAYNVGLVTSNPFANLRIGSTEKTGQVHPPDQAELDKLCAATTVLGGYGPEFRAMIVFAAWTGLRAGELFALRWSDVRDDEVVVSRALKADGAYGLPKNGKARSVPFLPPARVLDVVPRRPGDDLVFHAVRGGRLTKANHQWPWGKVKAAVDHARIAAGLPALRWHDLRHHCATRLLELGFSHFDVSIQLGHEDGGKLVMERYGHPSVDAARGRLLAFFESPTVEIGSSATGGAG